MLESVLSPVNVLLLEEGEVFRSVFRILKKQRILTVQSVSPVAALTELSVLLIHLTDLIDIKVFASVEISLRFWKCLYFLL